MQVVQLDVFHTPVESIPVWKFSIKDQTKRTALLPFLSCLHAKGIMKMLFITSTHSEDFVQQTVSASIKTVLLSGYAQIRFQFVVIKYEITITMFGIQKCRCVQKMPCCFPRCFFHLQYPTYIQPGLCFT